MSPISKFSPSHIILPILTKRSKTHPGQGMKSGPLPIRVILNLETTLLAEAIDQCRRHTDKKAKEEVERQYQHRMFEKKMREWEEMQEREYNKRQRMEQERQKRAKTWYHRRECYIQGFCAHGCVPGNPYGWYGRDDSYYYKQATH